MKPQQRDTFHNQKFFYSNTFIIELSAIQYLYLPTIFQGYYLMIDAALFITHTWSKSIFTRYLDLRKSTLGYLDVYVLVDASNPRVLSRWRKNLTDAGCSENFRIFTPSQLENNLGYLCMRPGLLIPGSCHYPIINFWLSNKYNYYWVIEYDIFLKIDWLLFFSYFNNSSADLICSHLTTKNSDPNWLWWPSLKSPEVLLESSKIDDSLKLKGFFPIYRASKTALGVFHNAHLKGWMGHCEALLPTIAQENDLIVEDFNHWGNFYEEGNLGPNDGDPPYSSLRWRPEIKKREIIKSKNTIIFHPVKNYTSQILLNDFKRFLIYFSRISWLKKMGDILK